MPLNLGEKLGPLPVWGWAGIATAAAGAAFLWERSKSKNSASPADATAGDVSGDTAPPDYVFQITNQLPPEAGTPSKTGTPKPVPGNPKGPFRRTANGKESLAQIARSRHTTVAHIVAVTKSSKEINSANLAKFLKASEHPNKPLPKGTVYYTTN